MVRADEKLVLFSLKERRRKNDKYYAGFAVGKSFLNAFVAVLGFLLHHSLYTLAAHNDKVIVVAIASPSIGRHITDGFSRPVKQMCRETVSRVSPSKLASRALLKIRVGASDIL